MTLEEQVEALTKKVQEQAEIIDYLTKKLYGQKSEKVDPNQLSLLDKDEGVFIEPEQTGEDNKPTQVQQKKKAKKTRKSIIGSNVPVKETVIGLTDKLCPNGHGLVSVGKKFQREEIHYRPAKLYLEKFYTKTYKCPECELIDGLAHLIQSKVPQPLIPHSLASVSLITEIIHKKFELGVPLYRQLQDWKRQGIDLSETTITNWIIKTSQIVEPLYQQIHEELLSHRYLQGDETPMEVLNEPGKLAKSKSFMWVMRSVTHEAKQGVFYSYGTSRASSFAASLYNGFTGILQCDGYSGYNILDDSVTRDGCWAHARRKFYDDANKGTKFKATLPLNLIDEMFQLERKWQHLSPRARRRRRRCYQRKILKKFWHYIDTADALPKSRLGKAITYVKNQRDELNRIVNDGAIDWSNNASERNMKSFVIGRKNWLFSTSQAGAKANAIWMTLIESAKANRINPAEYLTFILKNISQLPTFLKPEELEAYLPWNFKSSRLKTTNEDNQKIAA